MKTFMLAIMAFATIQIHAQPERKFVRKGNSSYKDGKFQAAEVEYRKALEKEPGSYKADYNLGNALYKQGQYEAAAARYTTLAEKETDSKKLSRYYYNLGNTMFESKKYAESVNAYKMALRNNPGDMDAKHNLQLALRMLQQQQQQQQNQGKNNNGEKQDQNKQDQNNQENNNQDNQNQQQQQEKSDQEQQAQPKKGEISAEDAERILQALENEEKEVMKRVQDRKEQVRKVPVDKNW